MIRHIFKHSCDENSNSGLCGHSQRKFSIRIILLLLRPVESILGYGEHGVAQVCKQALIHPVLSRILSILYRISSSSSSRITLMKRRDGCISCNVSSRVT